MTSDGETLTAQEDLPADGEGLLQEAADGSAPEAISEAALDTAEEAGDGAVEEAGEGSAAGDDAASAPEGAGATVIPSIWKSVGPTYIDQEDFLKAKRALTTFGSSMRLRGRSEIVPMQAYQIANLITVIDNIYQEVEEILNHLKDHVDNSKEHERTLEAHKLDIKTVEEDIGNLRITVEDVEARCMNESRRIFKTSRKETSKRDKKHEELQSDVRGLDEAKDQHAKELQDLTESLAKLDGDFVQHARRMKDENRRFDNAFDVAQRSAVDLKDIKANVSPLRKDLESVAKVVKSLAADVNQLKALPGVEAASTPRPKSVPAAESARAPQQLPHMDPTCGATLNEGGDAAGIGVGAGAGAAAVGNVISGSGGQLNSPAAVDKSQGGLCLAQAYMNAINGVDESAVKPVQDPAMTSAMTSEEVHNIVKRLDQVEIVEKEMLKAIDNLDRRANQQYGHSLNMATIKSEFTTLSNKMQDFEQNMTADLLKVQTVEMSHAIVNFRARWDLFASKLSPRQIFLAWQEFLNMRQRMRDALGKTKAMYAKRHAGARLQSWYYITQRSLNKQSMQEIEERSHAVQNQQETLSATVARRERIATEQAKDLHCRISMVEKRLEVHGQKKADQEYVQELFSNIEHRFEHDLDPVELKRSMEDLRQGILELSRSKTDMSVSERHSRQLRDLATDLRERLHHHDDVLLTKASKAENGLKANAQMVEQAVLLLARQADHLATLVSDDLELFRGVLGRFLELSPDIRKAALSLGLEGNERCIACRATDRKMVLTPLLGGDNAQYSLAADAIDAQVAQSQKIIHETLRFPSHLSSSLVAGKALSSAFGDKWQPVEPPAAAEPAARGKTPVKTPRELSASEPQVLLSRLRKMVLQEPGWLAHAPANDARSARGMASPSASSRSGASPRRKVVIEEEPRDGPNRSAGSRPSSAGSGAAGGEVGNRGSRQLVPARYFRASVVASKLEIA